MAANQSTRSQALIGLMRADAHRWFALGGLLAARAGLALAGPLIVRTIVDNARKGTTTAHVVRMALIYLTLALLAQVIGVVVAWYATTIAWRATNELRMRMTRHVLALDHEFHRKHTPGELIQRVDGDVTNVSDFLGRVVPRAVGAVFLVVGMIVALALVDWRLAIGAAVYIGAAVAITTGSRHRAVAESSDEMGTLAQLYGGIEERLTAGEDLRANGAGQHAMWRFIEDSAVSLKAAVRTESAFLKMWWVVQGLLAMGTVVSLVASAALLATGVITVGTGFLLFQYVQLIARPLEDMVQHLETVQKANGAMSRVVNLIGIQPEIEDRGTRSPTTGPLAVAFDGVSFDYGDGELILDDVTLSIPAGQSVGIIGRSGSGKTTISRLVLRLVQTNGGTLSLGGIAIQDIPLGELRRRVALVPQEVELFTGSIRDNVTLFDNTVSDEAVQAALIAVGLDQLVIGGIDRELGSAGAGLSAGQSQLLAPHVYLAPPTRLDGARRGNSAS